MTRNLAALFALLALAARGEEAKPPAEEFAARAAALEGKKDPRPWLALAEWAGDRVLLEEREKALRAVLPFDPENALARDLLDEKKWEGAWIPAGDEEAKEITANEVKGSAFYGTKWLPEKEAEKSREADAKVLGIHMASRVDTPHLRVYSEWGIGPSLNLAWTLEHAVQAYLHLYDGVWKGKPSPDPVPVLVFKSWEGYRNYQKRHKKDTPEDNTVSYYPDLGLDVCPAKQEGVSESIDALVEAAVEEFVCALDSRVARTECNVIPPWVHEGRHLLFGLSLKGRRSFPGLIGKAFGAAVDGADQDLSAERILATPASSFFGPSGPARKFQAFALLHFLMFSENGRRAEGFRRFLGGLPGKCTPKDFEREVGKPSDLEEPFQRYAREVVFPKVRNGEGK